MPSPFPGMDPYLEDPDIWEDFHANLAGEIQSQLAPRLRPRYIAAITRRVSYEEVAVEETQRHSAKPDVSWCACRRQKCVGLRRLHWSQGPRLKRSYLRPW